MIATEKKRNRSKHTTIINHTKYRRVIQRLGLSPVGVGYSERTEGRFIIVTFFAFISVACARNIIANFNDHNRFRTRQQVIMLAEQRRRGEWVFNGVPIIFGPSGELLDGGHRLFSIIAASQPGDDENTTGDTVTVVLGIDPSTFPSFDRNRSRKLKDACQVSNLTADTTRSGIVNLYYSYKLGKFFSDKNFAPDATMGLRLERSLGGKLSDSLWFITAFYAQNSGLERFSKTKFAFAHMLCAKRNRAAADQYFHRLLTEIGLSRNGVVKKVRELWVAETRKKKQRYDTVHYLWSILFWGWNRFCEQEAAGLGKTLSCKLTNVKTVGRGIEAIKVYSMPTLRSPTTRRQVRIDRWYYGDARTNKPGFKEQEVDPAVVRAETRAQEIFDRARVKARDLDGREAAVIRAKIEYRVKQDFDAMLFDD